MGIREKGKEMTVKKRLKIIIIAALFIMSTCFTMSSSYSYAVKDNNQAEHHTEKAEQEHKEERSKPAVGKSTVTKDT
jgi:protein involved in sex pheromone biosynthesis